MPAGSSFAVDAQATFALAMYMSASPRLKFGTTELDITADGEKRWEVLIAATFIPANQNMPATSDVLKVVIVGGPNPADGINPGQPVTLENFRVGISAPETRPGRNGGADRIMGGKPFYSAQAIRATTAQAFRAPQTADKAA